MTKKERFEWIDKIVARAETMNIAVGTRTTQMMDMMYADKQFNLRLDEFLSADDFDFIHDFCGIQRHMDRALGNPKVVDFFVPRFAGYEDSTTEA